MADKKKKKNSDRAGSATTLPVLKTYKMYVAGRFPRTESGRYYAPVENGRPLANVCLASRKDVRNAILVARNAQNSWASRSAYNRSQILYRVAEMLEGRREQFKAELRLQGYPAGAAEKEVQKSIDRLIYYCGWCDKYQQVFSSVNPVATGHFNFSMLEPTGVVFIIANEHQPLIGPISLIAPIIAGGNSCVLLASETRPLSAVTFSEVLHSSDVPPGVVNILTGRVRELVEHFSKHLDVNAIAVDCSNEEILKMVQEFAVNNVKRVNAFDVDWMSSDSESPYLIYDFSEVKTTWHPVEKITASGSGY